MAINAMELTLDLNPTYRKKKTVWCSQLDNVLRTLAITMTDGGTAYDVQASCYDVYIEGTKPDKKGFSYNVADIGGTVSGSVITIPLQTQMTVCKGVVETEIVLKDGEDRIGSANFLLVVEIAGLDADVDTSETEIPAYIDAAERAATEATTAAETATSAATTAQEVLDSIPSDYTDLSNEVTDLKTAFSNWAKVDLSFTEGFYYAYPSHAQITNTTQSGATLSFSKGDQFKLTTPGDNVAVTAFYEYADGTTGKIIDKTGTYQVNVTFTATQSGTMYVNMAKTYNPLVYVRKYSPQATANEIEELTERVDVMETGTTPVLEWINFGISAYDGTMSPNAKRLRTKKILPKWVTKVTCHLDYQFGIFAYNDSQYVGWWNGTAWVTTAITWTKSVPFVDDMTKDGYELFVVCKRTNNADITQEDAQTNIYIYSAESEKQRGVDYSVGSDLIRRQITLKKLGQLTYGQSFTKYNNKYYSTDGGHIGVQDADFNAVSSATLSLGHGNSFCLGTNGKAYVSGWDDNTVYIVDLETLTITGTIALPVTGYTTCAVDDVNELVYIFYRSTYPDTKTQYDLITYDYANSQILNTTKLSVPFAAMQACDIYHDRIIVLHGVATVDSPNGYLIFNTKGEIVAEYVIGTYASIEPEGVFIDRDNHDLLISYGQTGQLYNVSEV